MAILKNSILLENATGSVGNFIVKNFRDKKVLSSKRTSHKISQSKLAVRGRKNFASAVSLSSTINANPALKEIWKLAKVNGSSPFQKMMSRNAKKVKDGFLTVSNAITPEGLPLKLSSASVQNGVLRISCFLPTTGNIHFPAKVFVILYFNKYEGAVLPIYSEITEASQDGSYSLDFIPDKEIKKALNSDPSPVIYLALAGSSVYKKKVFWTSTAAVSLKPE